MTSEKEDVAASNDPAVQALIKAKQTAGVTWTSIGEAMGYKHAYLGVKKVLDGQRRFDAKLQAKVADFLGLPADHFAVRPASLEQQQLIARVFAEFEASPIGQDVNATHPEILTSLRRLPFYGELRPTVALYELLAVAMRTQVSVAPGTHAK